MDFILHVCAQDVEQHLCTQSNTIKILFADTIKILSKVQQNDSCMLIIVKYSMRFQARWMSRSIMSDLLKILN